MKKQDIATFVSFLAVLALTLIPILVPAEQLLSWKWRVPVVLAGAVAVVAGFLQIRWTKQDDSEDRRELLARLQRISRLLQELTKKRRGRLAFEATSTANNLLNTLVANPDRREFHPALDRRLFENLSQACNIGQTAYAQTERSVSPDRVLNEVERLVTLAIQHLDEDDG